MKKILFILMILIINACDGAKGPMGEQGIQGERGFQGISDSIITSWEYEIKTEDVSWDMKMGVWITTIQDDRITENATYDIWINLFLENSVWMKIDMYNDYGKFSYMIIVGNGFILLTSESNTENSLLKIYKIGG